MLYPAAREIKGADALVDEAEMEHASLKSLIEQLSSMKPQDEKYVARFTVLGEYVMHQVKEEEGEMIAALKRVRVDWNQMAVDMKQRRAAVMVAAGLAAEAVAEDTDTDTQNGRANGSGTATSRSQTGQPRPDRPAAARQAKALPPMPAPDD